VRQAVAALNDSVDRSPSQAFSIAGSGLKSETSSEAIKLLKLYQKGGPGRNIVKLKIISSLKFKMVNTGTPMSLNDIEAAVRSQGGKKVFVFTIDRKTVYPIDQMDGKTIYIANTNDLLPVELLKQQGQPVIELATLHNETRRISFKELVMDFFRSRDYEVVDLSDVVDINELAWAFGGPDIPGKLKEWGIEQPGGDATIKALLADINTIRIDGGDRVYWETNLAQYCPRRHPADGRYVEE
jgi:hypothetical protein